MSGAGLVSVIIPVYNRAGMLAEAVESALAQTHSQVEVLIVDDGSTDETWAVAKQLMNDAPGRVHALQQENAGAGAARNRGLARATGEYIQYLDSDDLIEPRKFEWQVRALRENPAAGVAYGRTRRINVNSGEGGDWARTAESISDIFPGFLMKRGWDTNSPLWRRSVCDRIGAWSTFRCMEDWEHDLRAGIIGVRPVQVPRHVATVRDHVGERASGMQTGFTPSLTADFFRAHRSIWQCMRERGLTDWAYLQDFSRKLFWIARMCGERGLTAEADEALSIAEEMVATRKTPHEIRLFRLMTRVIGWRHSVLVGEKLRRGRVSEDQKGLNR